MEYSYAWEKMHGAVLALIGPESMRERLKTALSWMSTYSLKPEHFPDDLREDFIGLKERVGKQLAEQNDDYEFSKLAKEIFTLFNGIR